MSKYSQLFTYNAEPASNDEQQRSWMISYHNNNKCAHFRLFPLFGGSHILHNLHILGGSRIWRLALTSTNSRANQYLHRCGGPRGTFRLFTEISWQRKIETIQLPTCFLNNYLQSRRKIGFKRWSSRRVSYVITFKVGVAVTLGTFASSSPVAGFICLRIFALGEDDNNDDDHLIGGSSVLKMRLMMRMVMMSMMMRMMMMRILLVVMMLISPLDDSDRWSRSSLWYHQHWSTPPDKPLWPKQQETEEGEEEASLPS